MQEFSNHACVWSPGILACRALLALIIGAISTMAIAQGEYWDLTNYPNLSNGPGLPSARTNSAWVWTGTSLWMVGGANVTSPTGGLFQSGAMYTPSTDTWEVKPNLNGGVGAPSPRVSAVAVWTGSKVIVFGGRLFDQTVVKSGGVYDPAIDAWLPAPNLTTGTGAPTQRTFQFAAWTGSEMVVFGGTDWNPVNSIPVAVFDGGMYELATDTWLVVPTLNTPVSAPEFNEGGVWIGDGFIARGGWGGTVSVHPGTSGYQCSAGGWFDTNLGAWKSTPTFRSGTGAYDCRFREAVWSGEWYMEFGGQSALLPQSQLLMSDVGVLYDPRSDTFPLRLDLNTAAGNPRFRLAPTSVWTGAHLLVWSGKSSTFNPQQSYVPNDGGLYDPIVDHWAAAPNLTNAVSAPAGRVAPTYAWTGSEMIVWGGSTHGPTDPGSYPNTGAVYVPPRVAPTIRSGQVDAALQANMFFRHRVTVYGCPRASVGVMGMPSWMTQKWLDTGCFLEGTPNAAEAMQTSTITITADNGIGSFAMQTIVVGPPASAFIDQIPNLSAEVGPRFEYRIPAGGPPYPTLSAVGMPAWMSIVSGRIEGYPTQANVNQVSTITVTANNGVGTPAQRTFTVTVVTQLPPTSPPVLNLPPNLPTVATEPFSLQVSAAGSPIPSVFAANKPAWMSLTNDILAGTPPVNLSGTTFNLDLIAINGVSPSATMTLAISIAYHPTDVTRDAAIDVVDVQRVVNLILALGVEAYPGEGDANGDSVVDVVDVQAVVNKILAP